MCYEVGENQKILIKFVGSKVYPERKYNTQEWMTKPNSGQNYKKGINLP